MQLLQTAVQLQPTDQMQPAWPRLEAVGPALRNEIGKKQSSPSSGRDLIPKFQASLGGLILFIC